MAEIKKRLLIFSAVGSRRIFTMTSRPSAQGTAGAWTHDGWHDQRQADPDDRARPTDRSRAVRLLDRAAHGPWAQWPCVKAVSRGPCRTFPQVEAVRASLTQGHWPLGGCASTASSSRTWMLPPRLVAYCRLKLWRCRSPRHDARRATLARRPGRRLPMWSRASYAHHPLPQPAAAPRGHRAPPFASGSAHQSASLITDEGFPSMSGRAVACGKLARRV
jgi:hypothetical protein